MTLPDFLEFQWDKGNLNKSLAKHGVSSEEAEEAFLDLDKRVSRDSFHSKNESRWKLLGKTRKGRLLFVVFTLRRKRIRVISARGINRKEVSFYEKKA